MKRISILALTLSALYSTNSFADSKTFVGVEWGATKDWRPNLVLGYKDVDITNRGHDVNGWGTSISLGWDGFDRIRLVKIKGNDSAQAEAGIGYSASKNAPLFTIGAQGRYLFADMDFVFDGDINGHIGVNTIKNFKID